MTALDELRVSLLRGRRMAARYRDTVGPCPRWDLELDELERVLSAKPTTHNHFALLASPVRTLLAGQGGRP